MPILPFCREVSENGYLPDAGFQTFPDDFTIDFYLAFLQQESVFLTG